MRTSRDIKINILNKNLPIGNGIERMFELANKGLCPFCGKKPKIFKDKLSRDEYKISGLCQRCQDEYFNK